MCRPSILETRSKALFWVVFIFFLIASLYKQHKFQPFDQNYFHMKKLLNKLVNDEDLSKELTQLIDTANAPIFGVDTDGNVNEWNQKVEQITGFTKAEVI